MNIKIAGVIVVIVIGLALYGRFFWDRQAESAYPFYYYDVLAHLERVDANVDEGSVLFIGDSFVQSLAVNSVVNNAVNFGIGHDRTDGVLARMSRMKSLSGAAGVVLHVGFNDLAVNNDDTILKNLQLIASSLSANQYLVLSGVFPVDESFSRLTGLNTRIAQLNIKINALCHHLHRCEFLSMHDEFLDAKYGGFKYLHVGDGLHLNSAANALWIQHLKRTIEAINE